MIFWKVTGKIIDMCFGCWEMRVLVLFNSGHVLSSHSFCFLTYERRLVKPACLTGLLKVLRSVGWQGRSQLTCRKGLSERITQGELSRCLPLAEFFLFVAKFLKRIIHTHQLYFYSLIFVKNISSI